jgi:hypothetical protein
MKTRLTADFNKAGSTTYKMYKLICANNEGISTYRLGDIRSIIDSEKVDCPTTLENMKIMVNEKEGILEVYENGKDLTYSVQETEHYTLDMVDENNLSKQIAGEDALLLNPIFDRNNI